MDDFDVALDNHPAPWLRSFFDPLNSNDLHPLSPSVRACGHILDFVITHNLPVSKILNFLVTAPVFFIL